MAEGLLRQRAEQDGIDLSVSSAGITFNGRAATDEAIETVGRLGVDLAAHRSRILDADMVRAADLVLAMERLHVREAVVLAPDVFGRTFTLKDFVRRGESIGLRRDEPFEEWLANVSLGRRTLDYLGESDEDDVADPFRRSAKVYAATATELVDLVSRLVDLVWGPIAIERPA